MSIKDYSSDADLNVSISGINIAEGCPPSGINNAIRQLMADVKAELEDEASPLWTALASTFVKKAGDAMSGPLSLSAPVLRPDDAGTLALCGASALDRGASLELSGADHAQTPSQAVLTAGGHRLEGGAQGWNIDGSRVISAAGGTMTGALYASGAALIGADAARFLQIRASEGVASALSLYGRALEDSAYAGAVELAAQDASRQSVLVLMPDGTLTLNGVSLVTAAGGQMEQVRLAVGALTCAEGDDALLSIDGSVQGGAGSSGAGDAGIASHGAVLQLRSGGAATMPGGISLRTRYAGGSFGPSLELYRDGTALWNGARLITLSASWRSGRSWYRKYADGWIEQGGYYTVSHSTSSQSRNLHTPFSSSDYTLLISAIGNGRFNDNVNIVGKATTTFNVASGTESSGGNAPVGIEWYACGL